MRKYTSICHEYIGYGSYIVSPRRIQCAPDQLPRYMKKDQTVHFVIKGWPIMYEAYGKTKWDFKDEVK